MAPLKRNTLTRKLPTAIRPLQLDRELLVDRSGRHILPS